MGIRSASIISVKVVPVKLARPPPWPAGAAPRPAPDEFAGGWTNPRPAEYGSVLTWFDGVKIIHHDDHRLGLPGRDQIIENQVHVPLPVPAGFVFTPAMQQVQDRVTSFGVRRIVRRRVDERSSPLRCDLGVIPLLAHVTMGDIFSLVEIAIRLGNFDPAVLPS
jgi:hypothetical protein